MFPIEEVGPSSAVLLGAWQGLSLKASLPKVDLVSRPLPCQHLFYPSDLFPVVVIELPGRAGHASGVGVTSFLRREARNKEQR